MNLHASIQSQIDAENGASRLIMDNADRIERAIQNRLKELRRESGLTQVEVAEELGESQVYVSNCESGRRSLDAIELMAFARVYEVDPGPLLQEIWDLIRNSSEEDLEFLTPGETSFEATPSRFFRQRETAEEQLRHKLKEIRRNRALKQNRVAELSDTTQVMISNCESGRRHIQAVELMGFCEIYEYDIGTLMDEILEKLE